ncbi:hypothetical protein PQR37_10805 [Paraburkholderia nemoris]|uniref:hypothetical protein n=1 Tax=Paraburkholderia nemoris TaxID=2793076 RepID=UPI0038B78A23
MNAATGRPALDLSDLTQRDLATLVFHAIAAGDTAGRDRVLASVPNPRPEDFRKHLHVLGDLSRSYAAHYWRFQARRFQGLYEGRPQDARRAEAEALALEHALDQTACVYCFDAAVIRRLARADQTDYQPPLDLCPDVSTYKRLVNAFDGIMRDGAGSEDVLRASH